MNEHLVTTTVEGKKALRLFESFEIDYNLPKHKDRVSLNSIANSNNNIQSNTSLLNFNNSWGTLVSTSSMEIAPRFWPAFCRCFWRAWNKGKEKIDNYKAVPVTKIFEAILGNGKRLQNLTVRLADYQKSIEYAKSMGQIALAESLESRLPIIQCEAVLVSTDFVQYIEENQMIDFVLTCERGLRLDWIKNFTRLIPHSIQLKKIKLDELRVFDNYVIVHYDPQNKASAMTKKEVEKKKDPILFGVIAGSRRLYHVGSWKDEFCNLTFDDLIAKYGKDVLTLQ